MNNYIGKIEEELDGFKIRFSIPNLIESAIAYPVYTIHQPVAGMEVFIWELQSVLGNCFFYSIIKTSESTILEAFGNKIEFLAEGGMELYTKEDYILEAEGCIKLTGRKGVNMIGGSELSLDDLLTKIHEILTTPGIFAASVYPVIVQNPTLLGELINNIKKFKGE